MRGIVTTILVLAALLLVSCGTVSNAPGVNLLVGDQGMFRDREGAYLEAETIPRIQVPDGMDGYMIDDLLAIPDVRVDGDAYLTVPRPRPLGRNVDRNVVLQRVGDRGWLVVDASANSVWPRIREFWEENGVELTLEDPGSGVLETEWFAWEDARSTLEKFRINVEPGFQDDSAEINLQHASVQRVARLPEQVNWPADSSDPEFSFNILTEIANYLADVAGLYSASSVSLMAGNIPSEGRASLITESGEEVLRLEADWQRSWVAVGRALELGGVEVVSEDESAGVYNVLFDVSGDDGPGFLERLSTLNGLLGDDDPEVFEMQVSLEQNDSTVDVTVGNAAPAGEVSGETVPASALEEVRSGLLSLISDFIT